MFIEAFANHDSVALNDGLDHFLSKLGTQHRFKWELGARDLPTGVPSHFLDIYPAGIVDKYDTFGLIYVRLWLVGVNPTKLLSGIFLGAARAEQAEPRRAAAYVRDRLADLFDPLERQRGFQYKTWGDADIWWRQGGMSVRAVTRQFEQYLTYKATEVSLGTVSRIEEDVAELVKTVDRAITQLQPIREFGKDILLLYYGENLPPSPNNDLFSEASGVKAKSASAPPQQEEIDWFSTLPAEPDLGDLKGMQPAYERMMAALAAGKHVLLLGAPGVGKTELAEAACRSIGQPYNIVTATSDWTSVHTIGGYMPVPQATGTSEPLDFIPGVFTDAMATNKWLIIDEMNRADIDKAFGEMFTLLGGKRKSIVLPYRKRQEDGSYRNVVLGQSNTEDSDQHLYKLDGEWRLIGTMNTFDKASLFQMSFAFSRRVAVIEIAIPSEADFRAILETGAAMLLEEGDTEDLHDAVLRILNGIFSAEGGGGLSGLGLRVGPAIPLDMVRFISRMRRFESDPAQLVLSALEMYLFPQFEGRHEQTPEIANTLAASLSMLALPEISLTRLRTFTGAID
ncbi:AAA family ATPase [Agrobacterium tumefaciens]|uniref:AAA family ATPase n=1 Tax=Agrobacterium tumefaciens TaxID=358 RepID=UPI001298202E|nr:AAA family ATPase [Agrobacterium tumefaciens]